MSLDAIDGVARDADVLLDSSARIIGLLEEYLAGLESGIPPHPEDLLAGHPDLADVLPPYLRELDLLHQLALGMGDPKPPGGEAPGGGDPPFGRLGEYRPLREVGRGGMGVVYEAEHVSLGHRVALKVLPFAAALDPRLTRRFEIEGRAASRLDHPNIVPIHAVGVERGVHYLAMRFVEGRSLAEVVAGLRAPGEAEGSRGPIGPGASIVVAGFFREAARLAHQAAGALEYAHSQGVLHRDIKPANLMIDEVGDLWVADFGLARLQLEAGMTWTGDVVGTLRYMSPEQAMGRHAEVDGRADVYALGLTLFELLTLRPAMDAQDGEGLLRQVAFGCTPPPRRFNPAIPAALETIVLKAAAREQSDRYRSAGAMADDLSRFLDGRPVRARRPSRTARLRGWFRRNPALGTSGAATALLLVALVAGAFGSAGLLGREQREARLQGERARDEHEATRRTRYASQIHLAHRAWEEGRIGRVLEILEDPAFLASGPGRADLRGWEWRYLRGLCARERLSLAAPRDIHDVAFDPAGRRLAVVSWTGAVLVWDLDGNRPARRLEGHPWRVHGVAFSPDGRLLATVGDDGAVWIWESAGGRAVRRLVSPGLEVVDGRQILRAVAFSPDGRRIAAAGWDRAIHLWSTDDWREVCTFRGHTGPIMSVAFRPDGGQVASGGLDRTARSWDVATGEAIRVYEGHDLQVARVAFSPDGATLATASEDETARLWDVASGRIRAVLKGHQGWVYGLAFSPDGRRLATASHDETLKVWDSADGREILTLRGHRSLVFSVGFHPSGRFLASGGQDDCVKIWDLDDGPQAARPLLGHTEPVLRLGFSPDGRTLAGASRDRTVGLWDLAGGCEARHLRGHTETANDVAFHPSGRLVASAGFDGMVRLWDPADGREVRTLEGRGGPVARVAFRPDGKVLATGDNAGRIRLWSIPDGQALGTALAHRGAVWGLAFGPDGRRLASSGIDATIKLWEAVGDGPASRLREVATLAGTPGGARDLAFHPDGRRLASAGVDGAVRVWDAATGGELQHLRGHTNMLYSVAFSPDGRRLASAGWDRKIRIWDVDGGLEVLALTNPSSVYGVAFSPDGRWLASTNLRASALLWDAAPDAGRDRSHFSLLARALDDAGPLGVTPRNGKNRTLRPDEGGGGIPSRRSVLETR